MADDLQSRIKTMNRDSAIRSARTAVTGAQNAGRMDSYVAAQKMGIELEREWLATLDNRTRHQHAMMDGHKAPIDKPFIMDGHKIMYPGDMSAPGYLVYNCRCTLVAAVKGVDTSKAKRRARDPETGETALIENMSYAEWAGWKDSLKGKSSVDRTPSDGTTRNYTKNIAKILGVDEKNIQISELPEVSQASIEKQVNQAVDYFPQLKGHLKSIKYSDKIADGTIALSHSIAGTIDVGPAFLDYDTLAKKYAYGVKIGQYAKGTTVDSILMHEMGHQVDGLLTKNGLFDGEIGMYGTIRSSQAIQNDILDVLGLSAQRLKDIRQEYRDKGYTGKDLTHAVLTERKWFIEEHVSGYAATNEREFLAECFSELVTSEHPREAAQELGKILEIAKGIL